MIILLCLFLENPIKQKAFSKLYRNLGSLYFRNYLTNHLTEIKKSKLSQFINWQPGNRYATLNIINFIGNIYLFGFTYDVKSQKFLTHLTGAEQFQTILSDIQNLSKNIINLSIQLFNSFGFNINPSLLISLLQIVNF